MIEQSFINEYISAIIALGSVVSSASCFAWMTPILYYFFDTQSDMFMTSAQVGFMIAIIELGELLSSLPSGVIADKYGRKTCILISGPLYTLSWVVILLCKSYIVLCVMRVVQGLATGFTFTGIPLYLGEISSTSKRGTLNGLFSVCWFTGYLIQYCVGPFMPYVPYNIFTACIPALFTIAFAYQPESPYYLVMKGKEEEARKSLTWLRKGCSEESVQKELKSIQESVKEELTNKPCWKDLVRTPHDRRAIFIVILITGTRIYSGAVGFLSYSTKLFTDSGFTSVDPDYLTILLGVFLVIGSFCGTCIVDSFGRRPLIFISYAGCFISTLVVGIYFYYKERLNVDVTEYGWSVPLAVILYCVFSVVGMWPISMTYTSELFTAQTRGKAASIVTVNLTIGSYLCMQMYQVIGDYVGIYASFFFYSAICLIGLIGLYIYAPETKGKTFTEIRRDLIKNKTGTNASLELS